MGVKKSKIGILLILLISLIFFASLENYKYKTVGNDTINIDDCFDKLWIDPESRTISGGNEILRPFINDFNFYKEIAIDYTKVSGSSDLINFPVLISIVDSDLHDHAQPDGDDIAFYNGSEWLDHEIELFNQDFNITHAQLIAWVRIPSLSTSTDTKFYMYYGNSTMGSQENPAGVWDNNYVGIYHLNDVPTGIAPDVYDSTFYGNDGVTNGSMNSINFIDGKLGKCFKLDGIDDYINISESSTLDSTNDEGTLSLWINWEDSSKTGEYQRIMTTSNRFNYENPVHKDGFEWAVNQDGDNFFYPWGGDGANYNLKINPFTNGIWHYLILTFNYSNKNVTMYLDGSPLVFDIVNVDTYWTQLAELEDWLWGVSVNVSQLGHFEGKYDEIRVSNITRSEDWITTEYNNQNNSTSFYSIGTEETKLARNPDYFTYYKVITIDHMKVFGSSDLINFPVLISIVDSDLHDSVQPDGYDIAFYSGNKWLDHEIELFNQDFNITHAQLIAWIRIPSLSFSVETNITMYYGNSTMGSQENPAGVWDPTYGAVWHLNEMPNDGTLGGHEDYTSNNNDGTPQNFEDGGGGSTNATGKIDGAVYCSGDDDYITISNLTNTDPTDKLTISAWIKVNDSISHHGEILSRGDSYAIRVWTDGRILFYKYNGSSWINMAPIDVDVIDNKFHYIVGGQNATGMFLFIDGVEKEINSNIDAINYTLGNSIEIGRHANGDKDYNFTGIIDEARISKVARSADWIATEYYNQYDPNNFYSIGNQIGEDTLPPDITINSPNPNDLFGSSAPNYNLTVTDTNLDSIWYSLDGGVSNSTPVSTSGTIEQTIWGVLGNGTVTIRFYANDTVGNLNYAERVVKKDIIAPTISITEPNNYDLFGNVPPSVNINVNDPNLDRIWYQLENASITTANFTWIGFIFQSIWNQVGNGTVTIRFYANDTVGNLNTTEVIVDKDIFTPIIMINSPNFNDDFNSTAPNFIVNISGSNLDTRWYTLDDGSNNYTFTGLSGNINQSAWGAQWDGAVTIKFYINNTLGAIGFDEITVIKDTLVPQITINLPLNNTYYGIVPIINILAIDANLAAIWYQVNSVNILLGNNISQQLDASIWNSLPEGKFYVYIYANDTVSHLSDPVMLILYKDTIAPSAPILISFPQGEVSGTLTFEWQEGSDPSGIIKYRLIIDNESDPFATPGFMFEINITDTYYEYTGSLQPGTYHFFLYQIDGIGHQSSASTGSFSIRSSSQPSQPSEFPFWIIIVIIGAAIGGVVGFVILKKSKSKKVISSQISQMKPVHKLKLEIHEELELMDYEALKYKSHEELHAREKKLIDYIDYLEENKDYTKIAEFLGELIIIEEILANPIKAKSYRQKQIDIAIKGLDYLKDQYEIESKKAAMSGDYSKALDLYKESKLISDNLKIYLERQESFNTEEDVILEMKEPQMLMGEIEIVYSCINDLLTRYFDEIGIKYYSNPQIYDNIQKHLHGLILTDKKLLIPDIDPSIRDKIKSIQIIYTEDISNENIIKLCKNFQNPYAILVIVVIKWPNNIEAQTIEIPSNKGIKHQKNIRIIHYELFSTLIGLKDDYETAFNEIIDLYNKSEFDILRETQESSEIIIHSTGELLYDLKEKGLIKHKLKEYFHR